VTVRETPGGGATFVVELPVAPQEALDGRSHHSTQGTADS